MKIKFFCLTFIMLLSNEVVSKSNKVYKKIECQLIPMSMTKYSKVNRQKLLGDTIENSDNFHWSGYVSATNINNPQAHSVKSVAGSWRVPSLSPIANSACTIWVGIDGYKSDTMEQIGTAHFWKNGRQTNFAWFGMYPNSSFLINNFTVNNNDLIKASVVYVGNNNFSLKISNETRAEFTTIPLKYTHINALRKSAQWIVECVSDLPLANFESIEFNNAKTTINNVKGAINNSLWQHSKVVMLLSQNVLNNRVNGNVIEYKNKTRAIPTNLNGQGLGYKVDWVHK